MTGEAWLLSNSSLSDTDNLCADLDRAKKEIEQLKVDHEVAMERRERQVYWLC